MPTWRADYFDNPKDNAPSFRDYRSGDRTRSMKRAARWVHFVHGPR
jgi:hypothetical protein